MQEPVKKKVKKSVPPLVWLALTVVLLGLCVFVILKQNRENAIPEVLYREMTEGNVLAQNDPGPFAEVPRPRCITTSDSMNSRDGIFTQNTSCDSASFRVMPLSVTLVW